MNWAKRSYNWQSRTFQEVPRGRKNYFPKKTFPVSYWIMIYRQSLFLILIRHPFRMSPQESALFHRRGQKMLPSKVQMIKGKIWQLWRLLLQVPFFLYSLHIKVNQKDVYPSLHFHLTSMSHSQLIIGRTQKSAKIFSMPSSFLICQPKILFKQVSTWYADRVANNC